MLYHPLSSKASVTPTCMCSLFLEASIIPNNIHIKVSKELVLKTIIKKQHQSSENHQMGSIQTPLTSPSSTLLQTSRGYLLQELQVIWDEVGEEEIEREKVLSDIEKECLEVYRKKVESANMGRSRLHQQLAECESQFTHLFLSLGEPSLPHRPEKKAGTLRQQIDSFTPALREMRLRKRERMNQFHGVQVQIQKIKAEIAGLSEYDETATSIIVNENDLSVKKLEEYQAELQELQNDKNERLQRADKYARKIHELAALLGMNSSMTIRTINPSLNEVYGITKNISDNILGKLDDTVKSLEEEKQKRLEKLRDLGKSMIEMWRLIDTPERERQQFFHVINLLSTPNELVTKPGSLTPTIIQQTEIEVKRLDQLKTTKMKDIFLRKQFELQEICSKWHMAILSPTKIANLTNQVDSGEIDLASLLETMDEEIGKAKEEAYSRMGIIEMVEKWSLADEEERWLEEYNMDDNRYSGSRGAHKNLKRAERARITVTKIPALVHMLISMVGGWEAERNKVFMYDEVPLVAVLEEYITLRREKEEEKQRQRLLKKKTTGEQNNMLLSPRPGTSTQRTPTRSSSVSFNNSSPTNRSTIGSPSHRRFSLSSQKTGSNNFNVHTPSSPFTKEGTRTLRQQFYTPI